MVLFRCTVRQCGESGEASGWGARCRRSGQEGSTCVASSRGARCSRSGQEGLHIHAFFIRLRLLVPPAVIVVTLYIVCERTVEQREDEPLGGCEVHGRGSRRQQRGPL